MAVKLVRLKRGLNGIGFVTEEAVETLDVSMTAMAALALGAHAAPSGSDFKATRRVFSDLLSAAICSRRASETPQTSRRQQESSFS